MKKFLSTAKSGLPRAQAKGFIDPISLITLGFLIVGLVVTTSIVKNPEKLEIRNWAKICSDDCIDDSDCGENEQCYRPAGGCPVCRARRQAAAPVIVPPPDNSTVTTHGTVDTTPAVTTTNTVPSTIAPAAPAQPTQPVTQKTPTSNSSLTPSEIRLEKKLCLAEGGTWNNNQCQFPETTTPTTTTPIQTAPAPVTPTAFCDQGNDIDCSARGLRCIPDTNGGYCESAGTPTCTPQLIASLSCQDGKRQQQWRESNCSIATRKVDDPACSQTSSAAVTQPTEESRFVAKQKAETQYFEAHPEQKIPKCSDFGSCYKKDFVCEKNFDQLDCRDGFKCGVHCSTPTGKTECDPAVNKPFCSGSNLKTCSNSGTWGLQTCSGGCANGACKAKPNPLAALNELGPPSGLGAGAAIPLPLPQSAVTSEKGFQQYAGAVGAGLGTSSQPLVNRSHRCFRHRQKIYCSCKKSGIPVSAATGLKI